MKTLNRTLSLVLVLVMVLGLFGVASAKYNDDAAITYKEAVDVVSAIGVIDGMGDNTFAPKGDLTREQAAKVICYLTMGKAAADKLVATKAPFTDVAADRWSAGSIAYAVQQGYISGRGDGSFDPTAKITGFEFAKLLLTALGYDATIEQFTGNSWAINVAKRAFQNGLFDGNDAFNGNAPATREEAALYVLNTLQALEVSYDNKGTNITLPDGTTVNTGASAPKQTATFTFMKSYYPTLKVDYNGSDAYNNVAREWKLGTKVIGTYAAEATFTYNKNMNNATGKKAIEKDIKNYTLKSGLTYSGNASGAVDNANLAATVADIASKTGNGTIVKIYADEDDQITNIVVIVTELAQITKVNALAKTVTVKTVDDANTYTADADNATYAALVAMGEKAYVLVNHLGSTITNIATPKTVEGKISAISTSSGTVVGLTFAGASYELAANQVGFSGLGASNVNAKTDSTLFVDSFGYAIYIKGATVATNYAVIARTYDSLVNGAIVKMATGISLDGTSITMNLGIGGTATVGNLYTVAPANATDAAAGADTTITAVGPAVESGTVAAGTIALLANGSIKASDVRLVRNQSTADVTGSQAYFAADVKFVYLKSVSGTWALSSVKTGVQNVAEIPAGSVALYTQGAGGLYSVSAVIIKGEDDNTITGTNVAYVAEITGATKVDDKNATIYTLFIDGAKVENVISTDSIAADTFVTYAKNETTGAYTLKAYTAPAAATSVLSSEDVSATAMGRLISTTSTLSEANAAGATIIDLTSTGITSVADIQAMMTAGKTVTVSVVYNGLLTSSTYNTVSYIFVTNVA